MTDSIKKENQISVESTVYCIEQFFVPINRFGALKMTAVHDLRAGPTLCGHTVNIERIVRQKTQRNPEGATSRACEHSFVSAGASARITSRL